MPVTWKINGTPVSILGFKRLVLRLINQLADTLSFEDAGSGIASVSYDTPPTVTISGGGGTGATGEATVAAGRVDSVALTAPGSGYTSTPVVTLSGGGTASAHARLTPATLASVSLGAAGSGYTTAPAVVITGGGGAGAEATAELTPRALASIAMTNGGTGYTAAPTVVITGGGGSGATGVAVLSGGSVVAVNLSAGGSGYTSAPTIAFTGGGGTGASATANMSSGGVGGVNVTNPANNSYGIGTSPVVSFSGGGGVGAAGTGVLAPTGGIRAFLFSTPSGSGYTSAPTVVFTGGDGSGAAATAIMSDDKVIGILMTNFGSGYTVAPSVSFVGGGGSGASASANVYCGIASVTITNPGSGYTSAPTPMFQSSVFGTAAGTAFITQSVDSISLTSGGAGYTSAPSVGFSGGGGIGATATASIDQPVASITLTNPGSGYTSPPTVALTGGDGSGATAVAQLVPGPLASLTLTNPGSGYTGMPTLSITGSGGTGATGSVALAPTSVAELVLDHGGGAFAPNSPIVLTRDDGTEEVAWFRGFVRRPPRRLAPEEELFLYTAEGPWQWLVRTPYLQNFKTPADPDDVESALVEYLRGRVVLAQDDAGAKVDVQTFLTSVIDYCAAAVEAKYGFLPFTAQVSAALAILVPWDEVNDMSCADAISRVLSLVPDAVAWFDYAENPPVLHIDRRQALPLLSLPIAVPGGSDEFAVAQRGRIELAPLPDQQREGVVLIYVSTHRENGAAWETYVIDRFPGDAVPNDPDVLVRTIQLAGSVSQTTVLTQKIDVDPIPAALVFSGRITSGGSFDTVRAWWRDHARELLADNVTIKAFIDGSRTLSDGEAISGDCPNELVEGAITDWMEDAQGIVSEDQVVKVTAEIEWADPNDATKKERQKVELTASIKATDAATQTYAFSAGSSGTAAEEVPVGLAQAIYDAISPLHYEGSVELVEREASVNALVGRALNISGDLPEWESMAALVQQAVIDIDEGRTLLQVGPPRHLGVGDLIDLFRANRTRPPTVSWETRTTGKSAGVGGMQGLSLHHPQTKVAAADRRQPRTITGLLLMAGSVPTVGEVAVAIESEFDADNMPVAGDVVHLTVSGVPKLSYRITLTALGANGLNVVEIEVAGVTFYAWLTQIGLF